jgi:hypothetical protein
MAVLREGRVFQNGVFQTVPAEPPIRKIQMHLFAQATLGPNGEAIPDNQHPDREFGSTEGHPVVLTVAPSPQR